MDWWKKEAVYQIYPASFKDTTGSGLGDIKGIIQKLPYVKRLGAGAIWLCPVFDSPQKDNGYDIQDYRNIYPPYGTMADMEELIEEAHHLDLKVIMDLVANHTSDQHPWFLASKDPNSPYRDYYYWRKGTPGKPPNNWGAEFCPSAWTYNKKAGAYYFHNFSPAQPDLNWNNPKVVDEICDIMIFWQEKGVDGWRVDAIGFIDKNTAFPDYNPKNFPPGQSYFQGAYHYNGGRFAEFVGTLNKRVWSKKPECMTVAELAGNFTWKDILKYTAEGRGFTMAFTFEHVALDADWSKGFGKWSRRSLDLVAFKRIFADYQKLNDYGGTPALYLNNHDQPRSPSRFLDAGTHQTNYAKTLAICINYMAGTPYIYQGEELGMTNCPFKPEDYRDLEVLGRYEEYVGSGRMPADAFWQIAAHKSRDNARTPMQWSTEENAGFTLGTPWIKVNPNHKTINAAAQVGNPDSVFSLYQKILADRKDHPVIQTGKFQLCQPNDPHCFTYLRRLGQRTLFISCNFTNQPQTRRLPFSLRRKKGCLLSASYVDSKIPKSRYVLRPFESLAVLYED